MSETTNTYAVAKRSQVHHYLNVGTKDSPKWERLGKGWKKVGENPNAQTESVQYICDDSATTDTTSYEPNYAFECDLMYLNEAIKKIYDIAKGRKTGADCILDFVTVDAFEETDTNKSCTAYRENLSVQVTSIDGEKKMSMSGNLNGQGDGVKGKFDLTNKTFTPDTEAVQTTSLEKTSETEADSGT